MSVYAELGSRLEAAEAARGRQYTGRLGAVLRARRYWRLLKAREQQVQALLDRQDTMLDHLARVSLPLEGQALAAAVGMVVDQLVAAGCDAADYRRMAADLERAYVQEGDRAADYRRKWSRAQLAGRAIAQARELGERVRDLEAVVEVLAAERDRAVQALAAAQWQGQTRQSLSFTPPWGGEDVRCEG